MKKIIVLLLIISGSFLAQGIYFEYPTSGQTYYINSNGEVGIAYNFYPGSCIYVEYDTDYKARLTYPDASQTNWMAGETGGWWVSKAGTYQIEGKAWAYDICQGGSGFWVYRPAFNIYVVDNLAPAVPQSVSSSWPGDHPQISWSANTEKDLEGYSIQKRVVGQTGWAVVATVSSSTTSWTDGTVDWDGIIDPDYTIEYKVRANDINGNSSSYSSVTSVQGTTDYLWKKSNEVAGMAITDYKLYVNYPNPFNPATNIEFQLPNNSFVSLIVYNTLGEKVATLVNDYLGAGYYSAKFDATNLPSGIYIYSLTTDNFNSSKKMILNK